MALLTALLVTMLMSALLIGFTATVMSDQRYRTIDRSRNQAFYAASAGVEKLTADLGNLFLSNVAPTAAQLASLTDSAKYPVIEHVTYVAPMTADTLATSSLGRCTAPNDVAQAGDNGYTLRFCASPGGNPTTASVAPIKSGPYEGLIAQQTPYQVDVTARTASGGEVHLVRSLESVSIPVFQFGIFSDVDLSFSAADDFDFGGRVHTNGDLYLAETAGSTLTLRDKVTAVKEIVRQRLSNGVTISSVSQTGTVKMATSPSAFRNLSASEGSVVDGPSSTKNEPTWHNISLSTYNSWIRNGRTGVKPLNLPLITVGGSNPDLIRRPVPNETTSNPILFGERLFTKASLRILLSDTPDDITSLPTVTAASPVLLDGNWYAAPPNNGEPYGPVDTSHPPIARSPGTVSATVNSATSGTNRNLTLSSTFPAYFKIPASMTVASASYSGTIACTGRTATTFIGCTPNPAHTVNTSSGTVSATIDGTTVSTPITNWPSGSSTVTVTSAMRFSPETFWINDQLITCTGHNATQLTGCSLPTNVSSGSTVTTNALSSAGTGTIGGYIKIERGNVDGSWTDVTMEILNYGIAGPNLSGASCGDPTPNAILRIQRLRDHGNSSTCPYLPAVLSTDFWPNVLFDTREAIQRDASPGSSPRLGGVMHYIAIDAANIAKWFVGSGAYSGGTGAQSKTDNGGFTVYFSDRRNNRNASNKETGEYGWEDFVNPGASGGTPNDTLDAGEDVNANGVLDLYGGVPNYNGTYHSAPPGAAAPLNSSANPRTNVTRPVAQVNRAILFRRALKLVNGATLAATGITGLSVVSENPVYIQGNWNANGTFSGAHAATAVMADTVTVLSSSWNDINSLTEPYDVDGRPRATHSYYRVAIISGKGPIFAKPGDVSGGSTFGTDGGAHSFLRMLEGGGSTTVHYRGSMATFFYNRQALGPFKCCGGIVYGVPVRDYTFDSDFLNPALLPPNTPMFRDLNAVGFGQELRAGR